MPAFSF